jgi:hypothetical protein
MYTASPIRTRPACATVSARALSVTQRALSTRLTGTGTDQAGVDEACIVNVCQPGNALLAAGYCMYSSSCIMVRFREGVVQLVLMSFFR